MFDIYIDNPKTGLAVGIGFGIGLGLALAITLHSEITGLRELVAPVEK